jgi:hypothetical protein
MLLWQNINCLPAYLKINCSPAEIIQHLCYIGRKSTIYLLALLCSLSSFISHLAIISF